MMEDRGDYKTTANAEDAPPDSNSIQAETEIISISDATDSSEITSIISSALNIMGNHPEAK